MTSSAFAPIADEAVRVAVVLRAVPLVQPLLFGADDGKLAADVLAALEVVGTFHAGTGAAARLIREELAAMPEAVRTSARTRRTAGAREAVLGAALAAALLFAAEELAPDAREESGFCGVEFAPDLDCGRSAGHTGEHFAGC